MDFSREGDVLKMKLFNCLKGNRTESVSAPGKSKLANLIWNEKLNVYEDDYGNLFDNIDNRNGSHTLKRVSVFDERFLKHV